MSGAAGGGPSINVNATANISQLRAQLRQAAQDLANLRLQLAQLNQQPSNAAAWQRQFQALEAQARTTAAQVTLLRAQINAAEAASTNLGISAALTGRKLSALIDESVAGRWRQFDGTLASVVTRLFEANPAIGATTVAVGALAAAVGYLAYQWYEADKAQRAFIGGTLIAGTYTKDTASIVDSLREKLTSLNASKSDINSVVTAFGTLPPAAAAYREELAKIVAAQAALDPNGDMAKMAEKLVKDWGEGAKGALKWADSLHTLTPEQREHTEVLIKAGNEMGAMRFIIDTVTKAWVQQGTAVAQSKKELWDWIAAAAVNPLLAGKMPEPKKAPVTAAPRDPAEEQYQEIVLSTNKALQERAIINERIRVLQEGINAAAARGQDITQAIEAVRTLELQRARIHTESEKQQHEETLQRLQQDLAAQKDFADRRVPILKQIAEEQARYEGRTSSIARSAQVQVAEGERAAADERIRIAVRGYDEQMRAAADHKDQEVALQKQKLDYLRQQGREGTVDYQNEMTRLAGLEREAADQRLRIRLGELDAKRAAVANNRGAEIAIEQEKIRVLREAGKEGTVEFQQAQTQLVNIKREAGNQQARIEADNLRAQIEAKKGNYNEQLALEAQLLAKLKGYWGEQSEEYQSELRRQNEMLYAQKQEQATIARQDAHTQEEIARLRSQSALADLRQGRESSKRFPSLLELLGGQDQQAQFQQTLENIRQQHESAMQAIVKQQEEAVNPVELNAARNAALIENQRFANEMAQAQRDAAQQTRQAWMTVLEGMESGLNRSVAGMLTGTTTLQQGMRSIFQSLVGSVVQAILRIPEQWLNAQIANLFVTQSTGQASVVANAATNASLIAQNAAVAGAGAYAATASIPIVGPELAPAAAAAAYAGAMSYEGLVAFADGAWNVPKTMVGLLHPGESIVPQRFAEGLRQNGSMLGSKQGDIHFIYAPQIQGADPTIGQLLTRQGGDMLSWIRQQVRLGALKGMT